MEELERYVTYALALLFRNLQREFGWPRAILITLLVAVGIAVAGILLRFTVEVAKRLIETWPRGLSHTKGMVTLGVLSTLGVLVATMDMPYSYYMLLRVLVCLTSLVALAKARMTHLEVWQWVFGVIAALYNPFLPVHLGDKGLWTLLNFVTVAAFWFGEYKIAAGFAWRARVPSAQGAHGEIAAPSAIEPKSMNSR